jgi:transcriptional regulator with XRE-family HTH domain
MRTHVTRTLRSNDIDGFVAERIRACRKASGLSQSRVAEELGVTFQQIQKYEQGTNRISAGRLFQLAALFNVPIQALYPGLVAVSDDAAKHNGQRAVIAENAIIDFMATADSLRLFRVFSRVTDPEKRKAIIGLVRLIAAS